MTDAYAATLVAYVPATQAPTEIDPYALHLSAPHVSKA